jgi:hypothetical protein
MSESDPSGSTFRDAAAVAVAGVVVLKGPDIGNGRDSTQGVEPRPMSLTVNGQVCTIVVGPRMTLLEAVSFVGRFDDEPSPLGTMRLGELTSVSAAPAIANAVYHCDRQAYSKPADHR